jgi:hypothetical protein
VRIIQARVCCEHRPGVAAAGLRERAVRWSTVRPRAHDAAVVEIDEPTLACGYYFVRVVDPKGAELLARAKELAT